jgi:hypothetical protein
MEDRPSHFQSPPRHQKQKQQILKMNPRPWTPRLGSPHSRHPNNVAPQLLRCLKSPMEKRTRPMVLPRLPRTGSHPLFAPVGRPHGPPPRCGRHQASPPSGHKPYASSATTNSPRSSLREKEHVGSHFGSTHASSHHPPLFTIIPHGNTYRAKYLTTRFTTPNPTTTTNSKLTLPPTTGSRGTKIKSPSRLNSRTNPRRNTTLKNHTKQGGA